MDTVELTYRKGVTAEKLMSDLEIIMPDIKRFIGSWIFKREERVRSRIFSIYDNSIKCFSDEIIQDLYAWMLERKDTIPENLTWRVAFFNLRYILKRRALKDFGGEFHEIGDNIDLFTFCIDEERIDHDYYLQQIDKIGLTEFENDLLKYRLYKGLEWPEVAQLTGKNARVLANRYSLLIDRIKKYFISEDIRYNGKLPQKLLKSKSTPALRPGKKKVQFTPEETAFIIASEGTLSHQAIADELIKKFNRKQRVSRSFIGQYLKDLKKIKQ